MPASGSRSGSACSPSWRSGAPRRARCARSPGGSPKRQARHRACSAVSRSTGDGHIPSPVQWETDMAAARFHLAWFTNFAVDEWNLPLSSAGGEPWDGQFYVDFAKALERACFDYIMLEDTLMVS